jgi:hypothetical protein
MCFPILANHVGIWLVQQTRSFLNHKKALNSKYFLSTRLSRRRLRTLSRAGRSRQALQSYSASIAPRAVHSMLHIRFCCNSTIMSYLVQSLLPCCSRLLHNSESTPNIWMTCLSSCSLTDAFRPRRIRSSMLQELFVMISSLSSSRCSQCIVCRLCKRLIRAH